MVQPESKSPPPGFRPYQFPSALQTADRAVVAGRPLDKSTETRFLSDGISMSAIADALLGCDGDSQRSHILRSAAFAEQGRRPSVVTEVALGRGPKPGSRSLRGGICLSGGLWVADNIRPGRQALFWTAVAGGLCRPIGLPCIVADAFIRRAPAMRR